MQSTILIMRERLQEAFDRQQKRLYDDREVRAIIDLLFEEVCSLSRADRILHPEITLPANHRDRLLQIVAQMQHGVPVQQALGYEWFCGEKFQVSPDVLIPRPETAELIEWVKMSQGELSQYSASAPLRLLDVGTGSGCIGITLARVINNSTVLAIDLSTAALSIALTNSFQQGVDNIQFAQCDILTSVDKFAPKTFSNTLPTIYQHSLLHLDANHDAHFSTSCQQFEIIISNPPYICRHEAAEMSEIVLDHEPGVALFVPDDDPLLFYRTIARFGLSHLSAGGMLFFEINAAYGEATCRLLDQLGYTDVTLRKDFNGRDRMVRATYNSSLR